MKVRTARQVAASAGAGLFVVAATADTTGLPLSQLGCLIAAAALAGPQLLYALAVLPDPGQRPPQPLQEPAQLCAAPPARALPGPGVSRPQPRRQLGPGGSARELPAGTRPAGRPV